MTITAHPESAHLEHTNSLTYRPDIDGLRAIAVGLVVLYHFFPNHLPGGFIGVDVFFVISGFLISSIILTQLQRRTWSYRSFYTRRMNRIFPVLAFVLFANLALGWFALVPNEMRDIGKHIAASAGFVVNFALWSEAGYFDKAAMTKPLLHMWSLAIEEQFYIVWPLILSLLAPRRWGLLAVIALAAASLAHSVYLAEHSPTAAYYSISSRFFELAIGGLVGWILLRHKPGLKPRSADAFSIAGLVAIAAGGLVITTRHEFPGLWALLPTLGTAAVIAAGPGALCNRRLLALPPMVWGGLISYSLYLWHWPVLVWAKTIGLSDALSVPGRLGLIGLAAALACATYVLIEIPMARHRANSRAAMAVAGIMVAIGGIGLLFAAGILHSRHNDPELERVTAAVNDWNYPSRGLEVVRRFTDYSFYRKPGAGPDFTLFIGDSNAEQYAPRIERLIDSGATDRGAIFATKGGCSFAVPVLARKKRDCIGKIGTIADLVDEDNVKTVVIAQQWMRSSEILTNAAAERSLREFLASIPEDKKVFVVLSMPAGEGFGPVDQVTGSRLGDLDYRPVQFRDGRPFLDRLRPMRTRIRQIAEERGATVIDPFDALCRGTACPVTDEEGRPAYKDRSHLAASFVREHATFIDPAMMTRR